MKFECNKTYVTNFGHLVKILITDFTMEPKIIARVFADGEEVCGRFESSGEGGEYHTNVDSYIDAWITEATDYSGFNVNDRVMCTNNENGPWYKAYFAGIDKFGFPLTFTHFRDKWASEGIATTEGWLRCRKPTEEELS